MTIRTRLFKLERVAHKVASNCGSCGWPLDGSLPPDVKLACNGPGILDFAKPPEPVDTSNDFCASCGRLLVLRLTMPLPSGAATVLAAGGRIDVDPAEFGLVEVK